MSSLGVQLENRVHRLEPSSNISFQSVHSRKDIEPLHKQSRKPTIRITMYSRECTLCEEEVDGAQTHPNSKRCQSQLGLFQSGRLLISRSKDNAHTVKTNHKNHNVLTRALFVGRENGKGTRIITPKLERSPISEGIGPFSISLPARRSNSIKTVKTNH